MASRSSVAEAGVCTIISKLYVNDIRIFASFEGKNTKIMLVFMLRWFVLAAVAVMAPLITLGVPSAALFAALVVGIVVALITVGAAARSWQPAQVAFAGCWPPPSTPALMSRS
jgi:hypothetical protein